MPQCALVPPTHRRVLYCGLAVYAAALLVYSQTRAFTWDESYHLLAAQLIDKGRKPYIDFCFPQTPLNAYWNAGLMRVFGQNWRVTHVSEALFTVAAVGLIADYVLCRFPVSGWRFHAALFAAIAAGFNAKVFLYGSVAQPYGIALFALVLAFRFSVRSPALAGMFAGMAAASSLLTAAAVPMFLIWILCYGESRSPWKDVIAYCAGVLIPFAPVLTLFWLGPRQTWFNLFQYHLRYRKLYWPETTRHDLEVLTSWVNSGPPLILGALAVFGLLYVVRKSPWERAVKAPFYLCAWITAALTVELGRAHPTFSQYFLLIVPFLAVLAAVGLYAINSHSVTAVVCVLFAIGLGRAIYDDRDYTDWSTWQHIADKIEQVTPPNALLFADEPIYVLTRRTPPPGFELYYTHKLTLQPADAALLHIIDRAEVRRRVQSEPFVTAYSCEDDDIDYYGLKDLYRQHQTVEDCQIFWDRKNTP
jgi:hypothetical protein